MGGRDASHLHFANTLVLDLPLRVMPINQTYSVPRELVNWNLIFAYISVQNP